jgi:hypothetical protein
MKVYLNKITGIDDAAVAMLMSKRTWTREKEQSLRAVVDEATNRNGMYCPNRCSIEVQKGFETLMGKCIKYGVDQMHTTLLRFIDLSFTVEGLHRAGQDDWDAHTKRMDNRIIRASTRLADFSDDEKSAWYQGKILYPSEVVDLPPVFVKDGIEYVLRAFGYVRADLSENRDVKRGLYPEAIPSNFVFKVQYPELCHIIQFRDANGHAHPEVQLLAEEIKDAVYSANGWLGDNLTKLQMEPGEK